MKELPQVPLSAGVLTLVNIFSFRNLQKSFFSSGVLT
jgi:hypothetical protein